MNKNLLTHSIRMVFVGLLCVSAQSAYAEDNMYFHGALVTEPCVIAAGDETITLDFFEVVNKDLYLNSRTVGKPFTIHLEDCDATLANTVTVSFTGTPDPALPDFLALDSASQATGIAIGMETMEGVRWPLNKPGPSTLITPGSNEVKINAYIQAEENAKNTHSIAPGNFTASATFMLIYE